MSYAPPTIPFTLARANPKIKDVLDVWKQNLLQSFNCHAIATVQSFGQSSTNSSLYTVTATVNYSKTYFQQNADGTFSPVQVDYPKVIDCPAIILGGGSTALTFPIKQGDQCLLMFNDRDLNNWFAGARSGPVASARMHSFADAVALVGFSPVSDYSSDHAMLTNGNAEVGVPASGAGTVLIGNDTTTLNTLLQDLVNAVKAIVISGTSVSPGSQAALALVATQISTLLE